MAWRDDPHDAVDFSFLGRERLRDVVQHGGEHECQTPLTLDPGRGPIQQRVRLAEHHFGVGEDVSFGVPRRVLGRPPRRLPSD